MPLCHADLSLQIALSLILGEQCDLLNSFFRGLLVFAKEKGLYSEVNDVAIAA